ncbi:hypothetical protein MUO79_01650 [Candidatus Bathyarchaeota archaeon]|nr:hypothetical protein [Candidatus Bathyarchaeota archaeon]
MFDQKGQIRIFEAFLAVGVMFVALLIPIVWPSSPSLTQPKALANMGTQALIALDTNGTLGNLITQKNWTSIKQSLDVLLPIGVSFNLTIYDENLRPLNDQSIQNTNLLGSEVVSVRYVCASQNLNVTFYILQMQMAQIR